MDKMTQKNRSVGGQPTSYLDLGYDNVGLVSDLLTENPSARLSCAMVVGVQDDNWQACGKGYLKSFHDQQGNPIVNLDRFPSMKNMTDYGHSKGLRVGWYMNK